MQDKPVKQGKKQLGGKSAADRDNGQSKNVKFAANTKRGMAEVAKLSQKKVNEGVDDVHAQLDELRQRTLEVQAGISEGFAVEDSKLLEAVLEHILFYWDDIMACLVDELIEEEVLELNRIDKIRSGKDPDAIAREELIDMLFEKKKHYTLEAPELGLRCTREL